jgi:hypothetical protein
MNLIQGAFSPDRFQDEAYPGITLLGATILSGKIMRPLDVIVFTGILTLPGTVGRGFYICLSWKGIMAQGYFT